MSHHFIEFILLSLFVGFMIRHVYNLINTEFTVALLKPGFVQNELAIHALIKPYGLRIREHHLLHFTPEFASEFYEEHQGKSFYDDLLAYMTSDSVLYLKLEGKDAIRKWRQILGDTDPAVAEEGTVRSLFGEDKTKNAGHGSDSPASATRELFLLRKYMNRKKNSFLYNVQ
mmetsp:Transcript_7061/g.10386  ORF Transcript_7061/g.10386 Transcript_7061/m.10386 type:complete len:172 (+) Transcript_7061:11-526(+)